MSDSDEDSVQIVRKKRRVLPNIRTFLDDEAERSSDGSDDEFDGSPVEGLFASTQEENQTPDSPSFYRACRESSQEFEESGEEDPDLLAYRRHHYNLARASEERYQRLLDDLSDDELTQHVPTQRIPPCTQMESVDDDDQSVASQITLATQSDDAIQQVVASKVHDGVNAKVLDPNDKARKCTFCLTHFPIIPEGEVTPGPNGTWIVSDTVRDSFIGKFPPVLLRLQQHAKSPIRAMGGQYECAPDKGTFHFQGWFQTFDKQTRVQHKYAEANMAALLRKLVADDATMFPKDGFKLRGVDPKFYLKGCISTVKALRDYCSEEFKNGKPKRAFPHTPLYWSKFTDDHVDDAGETHVSPLEQVVQLGLHGVPYLEMVQKTGKTGFMHTRNYQTLLASVESTKPKCGSRCGKWYCMHPPVHRELGEVLARKRGLEYNEFNDFITQGCDNGIMYCYGDGGTGKSTFTKMVSLWQNKGDVYFKSPGEYWGSAMGDCYRGERGVVFHEMGPHYFPSKDPLQEFKRIVDCTNCTVNVKNGSAPLKATQFYMDSNIDPIELFIRLLPVRITEENLKIEYGAYTRRFKRIFHYTRSNLPHPGPTRVVGKTFPPWPTIRAFLMTSLQGQTRTGISSDLSYSLPDVESIENAQTTHRMMYENAVIYQTECDMFLHDPSC